MRYAGCVSDSKDRCSRSRFGSRFDRNSKSTSQNRLTNRLIADSPRYPVTIAFDAWTNICRMHVTNFMLLCKGHAYFFKSYIHSDGLADAPVFAKQLSSVIDELQSYGIVVAAVNADNASPNKCAFKTLQPKYPSILFLPCAAHVLQLCIKRAFAINERAFKVRASIKQLVTHILRGKDARTAFFDIQAREVQSGVRICIIQLVRPNLTRWSSDYEACKRLVLLESVITYLLTLYPLALPADFWDDIKTLASFLAPFCEGTKIVQADQAGLLDMYIQFAQLLSHSTSSAATSLSPFVVGIAASMRDSINMYWTKHVPQEPVQASIHLSLSVVNRQGSLFSSRAILNWRAWLRTWATSFLTSNIRRLVEISLCTTDEVVANFVTQLNEFEERRNEFEDVQISIAVSENTISRGYSSYVLYDAISYWLTMLPVKPEISYVALALLGVNCSEASVERSFSIQANIHSLKRNRLSDLNVENEIFTKINEKALNKVNIRRSVVHVPVSGGAVTSNSDLNVVAHGDVEQARIGQLIDEELSAEEEEDALEAEAFAQLQDIDEDEVNAARPSFEYVNSVTRVWKQFCIGFIAEHGLKPENTWSRRGLSNKLESAMRSHNDMAREQLTHVKDYINFRLHKNVEDEDE